MFSPLVFSERVGGRKGGRGEGGRERETATGCLWHTSLPGPGSQLNTRVLSWKWNQGPRCPDRVASSQWSGCRRRVCRRLLWPRLPAPHLPLLRACPFCFHKGWLTGACPWANLGRSPHEEWQGFAPAAGRALLPTAPGPGPWAMTHPCGGGNGPSGPAHVLSPGPRAPALPGPRGPRATCSIFSLGDDGRLSYVRF